MSMVLFLHRAAGMRALRRMMPWVLLSIGCGASGSPQPDAGVDAHDADAPDAAAEVDAQVSAEPDAAADPDAAPEDALDPDTVAALVVALEQGLDDSGSYSVIGAVDIEGQGRWFATAGEDVIERDALVRIGSQTKTFLATVALQLVAEGALSLDDRLARWFPDIEGAETITIAQLLRHTSGVFDYTRSLPFMRDVVDDPLRTITVQDVVAAIRAEPPAFAPGASWDYSNSGFYLLGSIVEDAGGASLADLFHVRIAAPLGLEATFYEPGEAIEGTLAPGWSSFFTGFVEPMQQAYSPTFAGPAGGLVARPDDVLDFFAALGRGELLDEQEQAEMFAGVDAYPSVQYGCGVMLFRGLGDDAWGHGGSIWGYHTGLVRYEDQGITVFVATNRDGSEADLVLVPILMALGLI